MTMQTLGKGPIPAPIDEEAPHPAGHDATARTHQLLQAILDAVHKTDPVPDTIINLSPGRSPVVTWQRLKVKQFLFAGLGAAGGADIFRLTIGTAGELEFQNSPGGFISVPFPMLVDRGLDIALTDVTTPANTNWRAYMIAEPVR